MKTAAVSYRFRVPELVDGARPEAADPCRGMRPTQPTHNSNHAPIRDCKAATSFKIVLDGAVSMALCVNVLNSLAVVTSLLQRPALPPAPRSRYNENGTIMDFYRRVTCAND